MQYPPVMIIRKNRDGTVSYEGTMFDNLFYIARALNITYKYWKYGAAKFLIVWLYFLRYEFVPLTLENVRKFGLGPAQVNMVASGVKNK